MKMETCLNRGHNRSYCGGKLAALMGTRSANSAINAIEAAAPFVQCLSFVADAAHGDAAHLFDAAAAMFRLASINSNVYVSLERVADRDGCPVAVVNCHSPMSGERGYAVVTVAEMTIYEQYTDLQWADDPNVKIDPYWKLSGMFVA